MKTLALAVMLALSGAAIADENRAAYGDQARAWIELQKSPQNKAPPTGLPGEAADRVYQRYLQSFTRPIPERFERDRVNNDSNSR
ncbi:MAG TPA: DUF3613 domain-containing protein [Nevskiaceae bacterium]|nr:DUF3613 domain-containing protein [Nevskiaceae bacterium]